MKAHYRFRGSRVDVVSFTGDVRNVDGEIEVEVVVPGVPWHQRTCWVKLDNLVLEWDYSPDP